MKKAILVLTLLLFVGVSAQQEVTPEFVGTSTSLPKDFTGKPLPPLFYFDEADSTFKFWNPTDTLVVTVTNSAAAGNATAGKQDTIISILRKASLTAGTKTVTGSATTLGSAVSKRVMVINDNASGVIYIGGSGVTTATGYPLYPKMATTWYEVDNVSDLYVIGDAITVRFIYEN